MNLDRTRFQVSSTADSGVVSSETRLELMQRGAKIFGRNRGSSIVRGYLVGTLTGAALQFRFTQREVDTRDTYVILQSKGEVSSLKLRNEDGHEQILKP